MGIFNKGEKRENKVNFRGNKDGFWREKNSEGTYKNGVKTGLWKENSYSEDGGIMQSKGYYKDGEKIGIWVTSSNEGTKKMNYIIEGDKRIDQELYDNEKVKTERIFILKGEYPVQIAEKEYDGNENMISNKIYTEEGKLKSTTKRYFEDEILRTEKIERIINKEKIVTTKAYDFNVINNYTIKEEYFNENGELKRDRFSSYEGRDNLKYVRDKKIEKEVELLKTSITVEHYSLGKLTDRTIEQTIEDKGSETIEIKMYNGNNLHREEFSKITEKESFNSLKQYREDGGIIFNYEKISGNGKVNTILNFYDKEGNLLGDTQYSRDNIIIGVGKYNENGEKEGFWGEKYFTNTGYMGLFEIKDIGNLFQESGNYINGKKNGIWKFYDDYEIGDPYSKQCLYITEGEFKEGKLNGKVNIFSIDSNKEEKRLLDMEFKENSLVNYKCYDYVPKRIKLPNNSYSDSYHSPHNEIVSFSTGEYGHKITIEENGNTIIENYKENLLESKHIIGIEGDIKKSIEYSKDGKIIKEIDNQENKVGKESSNGKKNPWAKIRSRSRENER
ncbi:hypothetical protein [Fusobacterium sp. HMSC073F01]|uniref:hypothetical protein n=1 Tax=Fusobacterium sp. HMSC073F01 TaxID=1739251 RepID=UPI0008A17AA4|nr:hypothetical protein [Fusobacterium sp. HMSC073F01]OFL94140.1 hypothetical protein HMPREF2747_16380 [Fusobacterium sp. HMSC073F01]